MDLYAELLGIIAALDEEGIPYAVCGGMALAVHGAARATTDIDLLVEPDAIEGLMQAVRPLGFRFRASTMRFPDGIALDRVTKIVDGETLTLDLLHVEDQLDAAWKSRATFSLADSELVVISRQALIDMKLWAGRARDLADVERLSEGDR